MTLDGRPSPLLAVKYAVPPVRDAVLPRARLERALDAAAKLTVVAAPAGWGKTSLLARWAASRSVAQPVAWVSLDESDDEPVRFWSYVLTALGRAGGEVSPAVADALASADGPAARALPLLLNELAAASARQVLVLDDYHVLTHPGIHESVEYLVAYLPPALRIVIATRADPPLPLARMRVRGELTEVRAADLRFSADEAKGLLTAVAAAEPGPADLAVIVERTEGWAAGLQLAGLSLRGHAAPAADRHLFDYFTAEVLPALDPRQRDLLVRAAPLERLSGSLCDAALDMQDAALVLAELERSDLFVTALDREWFRCHRLLREALGWSPGAPAGEPAREVLRRAAGWFEEHGRIDDAVRCRQDAGDHTAAAGLLAANHQWFLARGWAATLLALGERLPEAAVPPALALALAYTADASGHRDRIVHWIDVCARQIDEHTVVPRWASARAAEYSLRGLFGTDPARPEQAVDVVERALALETAAGHPDHPVIRVALGEAYGLAGRFEEAVPLLAGFWRTRGQGPWATGMDLQAAGQLALFLLALDAHDELDRHLAEAVPAADRTESDWGDGAAGYVVTIRLVEGRRAYQRGDLDRARERLAHGLRLAEFAGRVLDVVLAHLFAADTELGAGDRAAARTALIRAREVVDNEPVPPFVRSWLERAETRAGRSAARTASLAEELTDRELSILRMLPGTATQREIGAALFLSINTVKAYNKSLYRKLGVAGRADAVRVARELGLI
ncbi:LuxR C-terminal-related transcriptional regulator [Dactylosporangium sp. CS-047395]|uniref:LuxR C-terminal-related transcriptional regulator n=1 Tax=Dactylosporangium sp. CS-047395 TaxID=3239936 RepID=UPI003D92436F